MNAWECTVCGYVYDPKAGDPDGGIAPGTAFEDISEEWLCPLCNFGKEEFQEAIGQAIRSHIHQVF